MINKWIKRIFSTRKYYAALRIQFINNEGKPREWYINMIQGDTLDLTAKLEAKFEDATITVNKTFVVSLL